MNSPQYELVSQNGFVILQKEIGFNAWMLKTPFDGGTAYEHFTDESQAKKANEKEGKKWKY